MFGSIIRAMLVIKSARLPRRMTAGEISLRCYRYRDLRQLYRLLQPEVLLPANAVVDDEPPTFGSFCLWMLITFLLAYVIDVTSHGQ